MTVFVSFVSASSTAAATTFNAASYYSYSDVLLVCNNNSVVSMEVCSYFSNARVSEGFNTSHIVYLTGIPAQESVNDTVARSELSQVKAKINSIGLGKIDYIVTTYGVPLIDNENLGSAYAGCSGYAEAYSFSIDAFLANNLTEPSASVYQSSCGVANPYSTLGPYYYTTTSTAISPLYYSNYHIYGVTRLDGPTLQSIYNLINNANKASDAYSTGYVLLNNYSTSSVYNNDWFQGNTRYFQAQSNLNALGIKSQEIGTSFVTGVSGLSGYMSWGSNCGCAAGSNSSKWDLGFVPGAIGDTSVSTGARTMHQYPWTGGQSLISDLVMDNITGVSGYVSEPITSTIEDKPLLLDMYYQGYTLADSYYGAMPYLAFKTVIIGDPKAHVTTLGGVISSTSTTAPTTSTTVKTTSTTAPTTSTTVKTTSTTAPTTSTTVKTTSTTAPTTSTTVKTTSTTAPTTSTTVKTTSTTAPTTSTTVKTTSTTAPTTSTTVKTTSTTAPTTSTTVKTTSTTAPTTSTTTVTSTTSIATTTILPANLLEISSLLPSVVSITSGQSTTLTLSWSGGTTPYKTVTWYVGDSPNCALETSTLKSTNLKGPSGTSTSESISVSPKIPTYYCASVTDSAHNIATSQTSFVDIAVSSGGVSTTTTTISSSSPLSAGMYPLSGTYYTGNEIVLTAAPSGGTPPYTYQWYNNTNKGKAISGATASTFTEVAGSPETVKYYVVIQDSSPKQQTAKSSVGTYSISAPAPPPSMMGLMVGVLTSALHYLLPSLYANNANNTTASTTAMAGYMPNLTTSISQHVATTSTLQATVVPKGVPV